MILEAQMLQRNHSTVKLKHLELNIEVLEIPISSYLDYLNYTLRQLATQVFNMIRSQKDY